MTKKAKAVKTIFDAPAADAPAGAFALCDLHNEVQTFFEYLKRLNPDTFRNVSPEFVTEALANFEKDQSAFEARVIAESEERAAALREAQEERQREYDARRNAHLKRIEEANEKVKREQSALINAQDELRAREAKNANP